MSTWSTWERCPPGDALRDTEPEIAGLIEEAISRQNDGIELIASENFVSPGLRNAKNAAALACAPECGCTFACSAPNSSFARSIAICSTWSTNSQPP
jgi:hypothetical protein